MTVWGAEYPTWWPHLPSRHSTGSRCMTSRELLCRSRSTGHSSLVDSAFSFEHLYTLMSLCKPRAKGVLLLAFAAILYFAFVV